MKFNHLQAFLTVIEHKSIRAAARALHLTQPAITKAMHDLERDLGVPLFHRSSSGVELTEYGVLLKTRAALLMHEAQRTRDALGQIRDGSTGSVAVAVSSTAALTVLPPAFKEFQASLPNADVEFLEASLSVAYERLRDGTLDFAVANLPPDTIEDEFNIHFICVMDNVIGARLDNKYANSTSLRQLSDATWLVPGSAQGSRVLLSSIFDMNGLALPAHIIRCQSLTVALALMSNSDMVSVFARPLAEREFTRHGVQIVPLREKFPATALAIVTRKGGHMTYAARRFADAFTAAAQDLV